MSKADEERLLGLIREHSNTKYQKVLTCAPDVEEWLQQNCVPAEPRPDAWLISLMGIDVVIAQDTAPGTWRLVRHDHCEVVSDFLGKKESYVSHDGCTIIAQNAIGEDASA